MASLCIFMNQGNDFIYILYQARSNNYSDFNRVCPDYLFSAAWPKPHFSLEAPFIPFPRAPTSNRAYLFHTTMESFCLLTLSPRPLMLSMATTNFTQSPGIAISRVIHDSFFVQVCRSSRKWPIGSRSIHPRTFRSRQSLQTQLLQAASKHLL